MVRVSPIKSKEKVKNICKFLKLTNERNYILFLLGIYSGLRISDILRLQVKDVQDRTHFLLKEKKTGKTQRLLINDVLKRELKWYCSGKPPNEFLILSRQRDIDGKEKPITRDTALKTIKKIAVQFDEINIGCHSMRKTFGYHYYSNTRDIATLQRIFNHSTPRETLIYIGIEQDEKDVAMKQFKF